MTPAWVADYTAALSGLDPARFSRFAPPDPTQGRASSVLILLGEGSSGVDVVLIQRAESSGAHSGQIAFPGGGMDVQDLELRATALREANEEIGLLPHTVEVIAELSPLWLPVSDNIVTPVVAWWREPHHVHAADPREVAAVRRVPLQHLAAPANRLRTRTPSGMLLPAFEVDDWLVWGFTAGVLDGLIDAIGLTEPWDRDRVVPINLR